MPNIINLLIAAISGVLMVIQGSINSIFGKTSGQLGMIIGVSAVQILFAFLIVIIMKVPFYGIFNPWIFISGIFGVAIMYGISYTVNSIGTLSVFALVLIGQFIASMIIDQLGLFGLPQHSVNPQRIICTLIVIGGVYGVIKS